jgi:hypothetical protein
MVVEFRNPIIKFFSAIPTILGTYILFQLCILTYLLMYPPTLEIRTYANAIVLVFNCILSYFVLKHSKVAIWIMVIFLVLYGLCALIGSLVKIPLYQYILKTIGIVLGIYWLYGAYILYSFMKGLTNKASVDQCVA